MRKGHQPRIIGDLEGSRWWDLNPRPAVYETLPVPSLIATCYQMEMNFPGDVYAVCLLLETCGSTNCGQNWGQI
jgi:hypothetical protein